MWPARAPARRLPLEREAARSSLPVEKNGRTGCTPVVVVVGGVPLSPANCRLAMSAGGGGTRAPAAVRIARQSRRLALRCGRVLAGGLCLQQHAAGTTRGRLARPCRRTSTPLADAGGARRGGGQRRGVAVLRAARGPPQHHQQHHHHWRPWTSVIPRAGKAPLPCRRDPG